MDVKGWLASAVPIVTAIGFKIAGAIILYMIGRWLISFAVGLLSRVLTARKFDPTLQRYIHNILAVALNIILVVAILGYFGVETTSFAALIAGMSEPPSPPATETLPSPSPHTSMDRCTCLVPKGL